MRKILVLRGGALGDFIVTLPTLLALRERWPDAEIELAGNATAARLASVRGLLSRVHSQHEARWSALFGREPLADDLNEWIGAFDMVVNFWPDPDGALCSHFPRHPGQRFVSAPAMPTMAPAAAHYSAALRPLGITVTRHACRLTETAITFADGKAASQPNAPIAAKCTLALHPGSGSSRKNWPAERWIHLIERIAGPMILVLGESEMERWGSHSENRRRLSHRIANGSIRIAERLALEELSRELRGCELFVGHDSGVSHLAAACGLPCVLLFGPTDPRIWAPPDANVRVLRNSDTVSDIALQEVLAALAHSGR